MSCDGFTLSVYRQLFSVVKGSDPRVRKSDHPDHDHPPTECVLALNQLDGNFKSAAMTLPLTARTTKHDYSKPD